MTKVQAQFKLLKPLDAETSKNLADTAALYGILRLHVVSADGTVGDGLTVEYDATRLKEKDVEAALRRAGVDAELGT
jgi:hypothetical protein